MTYYILQRVTTTILQVVQTAALVAHTITLILMDRIVYTIVMTMVQATTTLVVIV